MTDIRSEPSPHVEIRPNGYQTSRAFATYLKPYDPFPLDLSGISTLELHILNSRICRQREWEYTSIQGPHSETTERFHALQAELDARDVVASRGES